MRAWIERFVNGLSSLWLSCLLLTLLALLTWLGTLEQTETGLYEVQRRYFDSLFLVHHAGPIPIPLPGATLVMGLLFVNLLLGGILRARVRWSTAGILTTHVGIALLLLAGFVKAYFAEEGHLTLYEGERSNTFRSYHRWEIAAFERLADGTLREVVAPEEDFADAGRARSVRLESPALPFALEVGRFLENARVRRKAADAPAALPVVDGYFLERRSMQAQNEANVAGAYVAVVERASGTRRDAILWGAAREPLTVELDGRTFGLELRREQYLMPFTIQLEDFMKVDHPRMSMPKSFSSDVTVIEGGSPRPVRIEMNEPLRAGGLVLYQSSWGPSNARPGEPLFSTLAVVRNPADQYPLYACIVISLGLIVHFTRSLVRHMRAMARTP